MKIFRKYKFTDKTEADNMITALGVNEEGNPTHKHEIVRLGHLVETEGTYDEQGNQITAPIYTTTYHVDVLWDNEEDVNWSNFVVWCPPMGVHVFGSSKAITEWVNKCKELHPEYFPEPEEENF